MRGNTETAIEEETLVRNYSNSSTLTAASSIKLSQNRLERHERPQENTSSYTPRFISIGPLHHANPVLKEQQQHVNNLKGKYLRSLLNRRGNDRNGELQGRLEMEAKDMEQEARDYYELRNTISSDDFVDLLVLDGCFLIEFLLLCEEQNFTAMDQLGWKLPQIKRDILLLENQLPFFVLEKLYYTFLEFNTNDGTDESDDPYPKSMVDLASSYLHNTELWDQKRNFWAYFKTGASLAAHDHHNLLHLYHNILFVEKHQPPIRKLRSVCKQLKEKVSWLSWIVSFPFVFIYQNFFADDIYPTRLSSASEIEEAGVTFQGSCMDLRFEEGTLLVPVLTLNDQSFCLLRNLLAFEFYHKDIVHPYVYTYVAFLCDLIKYPRDLEVMEKHHIITGSNDESIRLINDLLEGGFQTAPEAFVTEEGFHWQHPRERKVALMKYFQEPQHRWWASFVKNYFGNPWSIIGLLVGVLLLLLNTIQAVFNVLAYYHPQPTNCP